MVNDMKLWIYADTSVIGGCEDDEFREHSSQLLDCFATGEYLLVLSNLTLQELAKAPEPVRKNLECVPEANIEMLRLTAEAHALANTYLAEGVISKKMIIDAQHIAVATVARVDVLVQTHRQSSPNSRLQLG